MSDHLSSIAPIASKSGLESVLTALGFALPPTSLVHVGIGDGVGSTCVWMDWGIKNVLVIEADSSRLQKARDVLVAKGYGADSLRAMIARVAVVGAGETTGERADKTADKKADKKAGDYAGDVSFFKASHPRESGLINPEALRGYWPSLSLGSTEVLKAVSVDGVWQSFLQDKEAQAEGEKEGKQIGADDTLDGLNWLVVDCLAGVAVLDGASEVLKDTAVVCVRALRDVAKDRFKQPPTLLLESGIEHLDDYLSGLGFRRAAFIADSHPDVGYGVYCRDGGALAEKKSQPLVEKIGQQEKGLAQVISEREDLNKQLQEMSALLEQEKTTLIAQRDEAAQKTGELEAQLATAVQEKTGLVKQRDELNQQLVGLKEQLQKANDAQQGLAQERDQLKEQLATAIKDKEAQVAQIDALDKEKQALTAQRDNLGKEKDSLIKEKEALAGEKNALAKDRDALAGERAAISGQLEEQKRAVAERQTKIEELTKSVQVETQKVKDITAKLDGVTAEKAGLVQQRDETVKKLGDIDAKLAAANQEKAAVLKQSEALAGQIETLKAEVGSLKQSVDAAQKEKESIKQTTQKEHEAVVQSLNSKHQEAVTKLQQQTDAVQKELESAKKSVTQLQQQVKDLESVRAESNKLKAENDELHQRQLLMNEELVKAEGQITLIKDLLLREQGI